MYNGQYYWEITDQLFLLKCYQKIFCLTCTIGDAMHLVTQKWHQIGCTYETFAQFGVPLVISTFHVTYQ